MAADKTFQPINEVRDAKAARKARQAFYTPCEVAEIMVREADLWPAARVLEPSAGDGRLIQLMGHAGVEHVDACETDAGARARLLALGACRLVGEDFLAYSPGTPYDRIVMNPPFTREAYVRHIEHAWSMLAGGGRLVALGPAGLRTGLGERLTRCDLDLPGCVSATWELIERGAFKEYGTGIEVVFAVLDRAPSGPEPEVCGFSNHSTANAAFTVEHSRELLERALSLTDSQALRELAAPAIGEAGGSCYGVDWGEVLDYLLLREQREATIEAQRAERSAAASTILPAGQLFLFQEVA